MKIFYLVHDLNDAAVSKRVHMLETGGAVVTVAGFRRKDTPVESLGTAKAKVINLGQTYNGNFKQRILITLQTVLKAGALVAHFKESDIVIARTLEMLAIAVRGRSLSKVRTPLVYESLDIHRLLLRGDVVGRAFRKLEAWLAQSASLILTSSPAFIREYFDTISPIQCSSYLLENKVFIPDFDLEKPLEISDKPPGPPWRIGWYGMIRCRKSLLLLAKLSQAMPEHVQVIIRGRVAYDQIPDFDGIVQSTPGLNFEGAYRNPDDLKVIYNDVHFTWAIDMYEEGLNSNWLMPNRIYEGGLYGSVPLAQKEVEIGCYLQKHGYGVVFGRDLLNSLQEFFANLDHASYKELTIRSKAQPTQQFVHNKVDCVALIEELEKL